ncbi:MAG TPA: RES family NAD+ phosphorylase [Lamprocystis sp. (in: g-proteobacteria)]|nr:RES family NAD+ phosphorylase [Lamprocystis sp. (in: g-proteobacteria)]
MTCFRLVDEDDLESAFSGDGARLYGGRWIAESVSVGLSVPSAVTPGEHNILLNPAHPGYAAAVVVGAPQTLRLDRRLVKG